MPVGLGRRSHTVSNETNDDEESHSLIEMPSGKNHGNLKRLGPVRRTVVTTKPGISGRLRSARLAAAAVLSERPWLRWFIMSIVTLVAFNLGRSGRKTKFGRATFTMEHLKETRKAAEQLIQTLDEYYSETNGAKAMLMESWGEPWIFGDTTIASNSTSVTTNSTNATATDEEPLGRVVADKLVDTMARALVTDDQRKFVIGVLGSSVAAGHENCFYDSYVNQLERAFRSVWEAAGMEFVIQNSGLADLCGTDFRYQIYCLTQNISPETDIIHYVYPYIEQASVAGYPERETVIRWAQMFPNQPPVHAIRHEMRPKKDIEKTIVDDMSKAYSEYGYNSFHMLSGYANGGYNYEEENKSKKINRFSEGYHGGDGYHSTSRDGELTKDPKREHSLGTVMRSSTRPGPLSFQLYSDAFTYVYTKAILQALDLIEKEMNNGNDPRNIWWASDRPRYFKESLPEPVGCDSEYCTVNQLPNCLNYAKPTFGQSEISTADHDWVVWHPQNSLFYMVGVDDAEIFKTRDDQDICEHQDSCGALMAQYVNNGTVVFQLPQMEVGLVAMCGYGRWDKKTKLADDAKLEVKLNGVDLDRSTWKQSSNCVLLRSAFPADSSPVEGQSNLTLKVLEDMDKPFYVSQIITL